MLDNNNMSFYSGGVRAPDKEVLARQEVDLLAEGGGERVEGPAVDAGPGVYLTSRPTQVTSSSSSTR